MEEKFYLQSEELLVLDTRQQLKREGRSRSSTRFRMFVEGMNSISERGQFVFGLLSRRESPYVPRKIKFPQGIFYD